MNNRREYAPPRTEAELEFEETEALIWDLLDDQLNDAGHERLSRLLEKNPAVRERYLECVQLHVGLHEYFGQMAVEAKQQASKTPVLSDLPGLSGLPGFPTVVQ